VSVHNLEALLQPRSVALFGADRVPRSIGRVLAENLFQGGFEGPVMPVHGRDRAVQGVFAYPTVADLPITPDLAVIASPLQEIPPLLADLGARGTRGAVIVSHDGFAAGSGDRAALQDAMRAAAKPHGLRLVGPACLGLMVPSQGLNASYAHIRAADGDLAFIAQSGSLMTLMLDWAAARGVGFSLLAALGDMIDIDLGDMLDHLAFDPQTRAVLLCVDRIEHPRKFLSAARAAARLKPVIVFDAGSNGDKRRMRARSGGVLRDAPPANGLHPGRSEVNDAAFRRAGLLPVPSLADLVAAAGTLGTGIRVAGDRLLVIANGRGIAEVTAEIVLAEGGNLAQPSEATLAALDRVLPPSWGRRNPVNLFADATASRWCDALGPLLADEGVDAVVAINTPTAIGDTLEAARAVVETLEGERKPLAAVWLEESTLDETRRLFAQRRVPLHDGPGPAVEALMQLVRWRRNQDMLMQVPASLPDLFDRDRDAAERIVGAALASGRTWLSEPEAKAVLAAYGLPVLASEDATTPEDAAAVAGRLGFPVSIRPSGLAVTGEAHAVSIGIALQLDTPEQVEQAASRLQRRFAERRPDVPFPGFTVRAQAAVEGRHELQMGITLDERFGPLVLFGEGGEAARVIPDGAIGLPPLNLGLARMLIAETRAQRLLQGYGDRPAADLDEVALALVKLAQIGSEIAGIVEIDVNPLLAGRDGVLVIAAGIRLAPPAGPAGARLAIRPYPIELEKSVQARDGRSLLLRPIRPEDEPALRTFVRALTPEDRRLRFFSHVKELDARLAARLTQIDYDREMAFVLIDPGEDETAILGVMRISADPDGSRAEYAGAVRSTLKGLGLGRLLLEEICDYARTRGIAEVWGEVLAENAPMLGLVRKLGFNVHVDPEDRSVVVVRRPLQAVPSGEA